MHLEISDNRRGDRVHFGRPISCRRLGGSKKISTRQSRSRVGRLPRCLAMRPDGLRDLAHLCPLVP